MMPPFAPPKGIFTTAHFHVIQLASARTSSRFTSGAYRNPPLAGPRAIECWTRKPVKTSRRPIVHHDRDMDDNLAAGALQYFPNPASRFSFFAAISKRAACAFHGLVSSARSIVFVVIKSPNDCDGPHPKAQIGLAKYIAGQQVLGSAHFPSVILSATEASRSGAAVESKDPIPA